jgi:hypothetical protein
LLTGSDLPSTSERRVREKSSAVKRLWLPADVCYSVRRDFPHNTHRIYRH